MVDQIQRNRCVSPFFPQREAAFFLPRASVLHCTTAFDFDITGHFIESLKVFQGLILRCSSGAFVSHPTSSLGSSSVSFAPSRTKVQLILCSRHESDCSYCRVYHGMTYLALLAFPGLIRSVTSIFDTALY